jgi:deoxyribose-phosphate aldolase
MNSFIERYNPVESQEQIEKKISDIISKSNSLYQPETLKKIFSLIDLTSLNATDTNAQISAMVEKVNEFQSHFPGRTNVGAICVYPSFVPLVKANLKAAKVGIAAVVGGFPASQTFIELKVAETKRVVKEGAKEADMVISIGKLTDGDYDTVFEEIKAIKEACGEAHLKVILESGVLDNEKLIKDASILALEAGADFLKTSTGKMPQAATLKAVYIMTQAIQEFYNKTGKKVGIKPSGGISTGKQAVEYLSIVKHNLGDAWFNQSCFRIGASSLANNLLNEIAQLENPESEIIKYF